MGSDIEIPNDAQIVNDAAAAAPVEVRTAPDAFEAQIGKAALVDFVNLLSALDDEAKIHVEPAGLSCMMVDAAHVAMLDIALDAGAFNEYHVEGEGDLALDLEKLKKVLKFSRKKTDIIHLKMNEAGEILTVGINGMERTMEVLDPAGFSSPHMPKVNLNSHFSIDSGEFEETIKQCKEVSDYLTMSVTPAGLTIGAKGYKDEVKNTIPREMLADFATAEGDKSHFPLDYMTNIVKPMGCYDAIKVDLGTNFPIKMEGVSKTMRALFMLGPRIEEED